MRKDTVRNKSKVKRRGVLVGAYMPGELKNVLMLEAKKQKTTVSKVLVQLVRQLKQENELGTPEKL